MIEVMLRYNDKKTEEASADHIINKSGELVKILRDL